MPANLKLNLFKYLFNIDLAGIKSASVLRQVILFPLQQAISFDRQN